MWELARKRTPSSQGAQWTPDATNALTFTALRLTFPFRLPRFPYSNRILVAPPFESVAAQLHLDAINYALAHPISQRNPSPAFTHGLRMHWFGATTEGVSARGLGRGGASCEMRSLGYTNFLTSCTLASQELNSSRL